MYCKSIYRHSIFLGAIRDPETVEKDFLRDVKKLTPSDVRENKTRVFIAYHDGPEFIYYQIPLSYKKYLEVK